MKALVERKPAVKHSIAWRFIGYVFLLSSIMTLSGTFFELRSEYSMEIKSINGTLDLIEKGYLPSLVNSLWIADQDMTNTLLMGIRRLPDICHLRIDRPDQPPELIEKPNQRMIEHQYPLSFMHDGMNVPLGKLHVWASLDNVYERLEDRFLVILGTQGAGVFLTSILIYFLFHTLVGRHIYAMGSYAKTLHLDELAEPLSLTGKKNRGDELDHLLFSINQMKITINEELMRRAGIEKELIESEVQLKKANQIMAGILEHTHILAVLLDRQFNFIWVNRAYANACRYDPSFFPGKNHFELYPNEENQAIFQRVVDTGEPFFVASKSFEYPDQPERGVTYWNWSLIPIKDGSGKVTDLVFTLVEVTDRISAEQGLLREKVLNDAIVQNIPAGIAFLDNNFILKKFNPPYGEMIKKYTSYTPEQALGMSYFDYVPGSREQVEPWFRKVRDTGVAETRHDFRLSIKQDRKEESTYWDTSVAPVITPDGVEEGILILTQDVTPRNIAEEALRKGEERYRTLVNTSPFGIQLTDLEGKIIFSNPAHHKIQGYADGELIGKYIWDLMADETQKSRAREYYTKLVQEQPRPEVYYSRDSTKNGRSIDVQIDWDYVRNSTGQAEAIISIVSDITKRKRAEEALKESEHRYRTLFERTSNPILIIDPDGNYVNGNMAGLQFLECTREELLKKNVRDYVVVSEDRDRVLAPHKEMWSSGGRMETDHLVQGNVKTLDLNITPVIWKDKPVVFGVGTDITERKRVEDALRESELRYRIVADNTYDWEFWIGADGKVLYTSPSCERISGRNAKDFMDDPDLLLKIINPEDRQRYLMHHNDSLKRTEEISVEFRIIRPDGEERWVEHVCHPIFDHAGKPLGRRGSNKDCTERKRAEDEKAKLQAQLLQAQKMEALGTLAGGIAHDFNNSLGAILGFAEMAMLEARGSEKLKDYLGSVYKAGERARDLVKQILLFSRQMKTELRPVRMGFVVSETMKLLRPALPSTVEIHQEMLTEEDIIQADLTQLHQVILNLCTNAAHAMKEKGGVLKILIRSKQIDSETARLFLPEVEPGMYVVLEVSDTGHGIKKEVLPMIFDPFFTTKNPGEGTGMGLAVVHGIIVEHGGAIRVESRVGEGTTFNVYIPCFEGSEPPSQEVLSFGPSEEEGRVLYVDDEAAMVKVGSLMLSKIGYDVVPSTSSQRALELFQNQPDYFNAAVLDMTMPGMTGLDLAMEMMKLRPGFPTIIVTGYSDLVNTERLKTAGVREVLLKPFSQKDLADSVRRARGKNG